MRIESNNPRPIQAVPRDAGAVERELSASFDESFRAFVDHEVGSPYDIESKFEQMDLKEQLANAFMARSQHFVVTHHLGKTILSQT